jgi:hypothetical protein
LSIVDFLARKIADRRRKFFEREREKNFSSRAFCFAQFHQILIFDMQPSEKGAFVAQSSFDGARWSANGTRKCQRVKSPVLQDSTRTRH